MCSRSGALETWTAMLLDIERGEKKVTPMRRNTGARASLSYRTSSGLAGRRIIACRMSCAASRSLSVRTGGKRLAEVRISPASGPPVAGAKADRDPVEGRPTGRWSCPRRDGHVGIE
jgi:hypothetical protein